jgi:hypothetical protein
MSDVTPPQAGWYADPENPAGERWWNGSGWSDHKRDATEPAVAGAATAEVVPPVPGDPMSANPLPADPVGFTFGAPTLGSPVPRPDPYSAVPPATPSVPAAVGVTAAAPYAASPYAASPYVASPYVPAPYGSPAYGYGTNGLALAGLLVAAAGWLVVPIIAPIAGMVMSGFGLRQARQREAAGNPNSGRGMAMAGLIVGGLVALFSLLIVIVYIVALVSIMNPVSYG